MTGRPVDLGRVRRALAALDELAAHYPDRVTGRPTEDEITALAGDLENVMTDEKMNERLGVRVSPELRVRMEAYRKTVAESLPAGVREPTLSDVARMLIVRALDAIESDHG